MAAKGMQTTVRRRGNRLERTCVHHLAAASREGWHYGTGAVRVTTRGLPRPAPLTTGRRRAGAVGRR
jgi:hypothetical protein